MNLKYNLINSIKININKMKMLYKDLETLLDVMSYEIRELVQFKVIDKYSIIGEYSGWNFITNIFKNYFILTLVKLWDCPGSKNERATIPAVIKIIKNNANLYDKLNYNTNIFMQNLIKDYDSFISSPTYSNLKTIRHNHIAHIIKNRRSILETIPLDNTPLYEIYNKTIDIYNSLCFLIIGQKSNFEEVLDMPFKNNPTLNLSSEYVNLIKRLDVSDFFELLKDKGVLKIK